MVTWNNGRPVDLSTTDFIAGREIDSNVGLVVSAEKLGRGGTSNVEETTEEAVKLLIETAQNADADAIIGLKIKAIQPTSEHADQHYSILCYGTAVKLKLRTRSD